MERYGRQVYDDTLGGYDSTCGFWMIGVCLAFACGFEINSLGHNSATLKQAIWELYSDYRAGPLQGLSTEVFESAMVRFKPDIIQICPRSKVSTTSVALRYMMHFCGILDFGEKSRPI